MIAPRFIQAPTIRQSVAVYKFVRAGRAALNALPEPLKSEISACIKECEIQFLLPPVVNDNRTESDLDRDLSSVSEAMETRHV
jgi:hypothetical protein